MNMEKLTLYRNIMYVVISAILILIMGKHFTPYELVIVWLLFVMGVTMCDISLEMTRWRNKKWSG